MVVVPPLPVRSLIVPVQTTIIDMAVMRLCDPVVVEAEFSVIPDVVVAISGIVGTIPYGNVGSASNNCQR